jgi:hypothetical protein
LSKVALPKTPVPGVGAVAAIIDPQGNICGLWEQANKKVGGGGFRAVGSGRTISSWEAKVSSVVP